MESGKLIVSFLLSIFHYPLSHYLGNLLNPVNLGLTYIIIFTNTIVHNSCQGAKTMSRYVRAIVLAMVLMLLSASACMAQTLSKVLVFTCHSPQSYAYTNEIRNLLVSTGQFSQVDTLTVDPSWAGQLTNMPTLSLLQQYDAVLLDCGINLLVSPTNYLALVDTLMSQYIAGGGAVVYANGNNCTFALPPYEQVFSPPTSATTAVTGYPAGLSANASGAVSLGTVALPNHPIMIGVHSFTGSASVFSHLTDPLVPGAYLIASYNPVAGGNMVAAREGVGPKNVRRVDINFNPWQTERFYFIQFGFTTFGWDQNTDGAKLMANALTWAGQKAYDLSADIITNPANQTIETVGSPFIPTVQISNHGYQIPTSVTVRFQITPYGSATPVYSHDTVLTGASIPAGMSIPATAFPSVVIQFPAFTPMLQGVLYEDTVIILNLQPVADQKPLNNIATSEFKSGYANDIQAIGFEFPQANSYQSAGVLLTPVDSLTNVGGNDWAFVPVVTLIKDQAGTIVYRDTVIIPSFPSGQFQRVTFPNLTLTNPGLYTACVIALLPSDQQRSNDTACEIFHVRYDYDAATLGIINPQPDEEKPYTLSWQPTALFQSHGAQDLFNVPVRVQIRRCSDGALVFQADSNIIALNTDQNQQLFSFPSKQGVYDVSKLPPGCYNICAMTLLPNDADRSNDTACSSFSVIDRLKGNIFVGVGQRFPSIHAAVDSLRFRGVGGNVRLILTDNNYTENGTYRISSNFGAIDFSGIRGLADTATVTWIPNNTGVQPHIVFTAPQPFCFYFGDQFGGHIIFEGYNPAGAGGPDQLVSEPNKRSFTLVNNGASAGSIFAFEEGASNITLKDLVLKNNGIFSKDSSAVVRLYNEQSRLLYTGRTGVAAVRDTVPIHNIRVENCELGNAKYGIWDHALHTQFNIGKSIFVDWRNYNNVFTRNTIGTSASPLSYAGIQFNNEQNLTISHNEISNVTGSLGGWANVYGIVQPSVLQADTGDVVGVWIDANRVRGLTASGMAYGIAFQQAATIYTVGTGPNAVHSTLPSVTSNRATNNMILDLRGLAANYPLTYTTSAATYSTDRDSIFNNSISTKNATINIFIAQTKHAFLWNNIIQNTGVGSYTNYSLQLPRPFQSAVSSDYNLFDLRGSNTFATVNEYDLTSGTAIQTRTFRRLNDWRTFTQQDLHSLTGDPLFASDSLHEPAALSYIETPASNSGAWLNTATQLHDFDGDLRLQSNQTPDIGADEFDGFQYSNDLAVLSITQPAGYSATSDTTSVTIENPLWVTGSVKNLSSQAVFNVPVSATVEVAISGGPWTTIFSGTTSPMNFEVNETKSVTFKGPVITSAQAQTGVFRVTVTVPNDQNNANNSAQKVFRVLLKNNATLVTYNSFSAFGLKNRDSVTAALRRLGIAYDTLDRNVYGSTDIDYSPWWTLIWSSGDPRPLLPMDCRLRRLAREHSASRKPRMWSDICKLVRPTRRNRSSWLDRISHSTMHSRRRTMRSPIRSSQRRTYIRSIGRTLQRAAHTPVSSRVSKLITGSSRIT